MILKKIIFELFAKNNQENGSLYLQITRGFSKRVQIIEKNIEATIFAKINPLLGDVKKKSKSNLSNHYRRHSLEKMRHQVNRLNCRKYGQAKSFGFRF